MWEGGGASLAALLANDAGIVEFNFQIRSGNLITNKSVQKGSWL